MKIQKQPIKWAIIININKVKNSLSNPSLTVKKLANYLKNVPFDLNIFKTLNSFVILTSLYNLPILRVLTSELYPPGLLP